MSDSKKVIARFYQKLEQHGFDMESIKQMEHIQELEQCFAQALEDVMSKKKVTKKTRKPNKKTGYGVFRSEKMDKKNGGPGWDRAKAAKEWSRIKDTKAGKPYHTKAAALNKQLGL